MANPTVTYQGDDGRVWIDVTEAKTLAAASSGIVQNVLFDNAVITLPSTVIGHCYTIRNGGVPVSTTLNGSGSNGQAKVSVSPAAADQIIGGGTASFDNKDLINTKATSIVGDEVQLIGDGTVAGGWVTKHIVGIWAAEA